MLFDIQRIRLSTPIASFSPVPSILIQCAGFSKQSQLEKDTWTVITLVEIPGFLAENPGENVPPGF